MVSSWQVITAPAIAYAVYRIVKWFIYFRSYRAIFHKCPGETEFHWLYGTVHLYPGPNEAGLQYDRDLPKRFPKFNRIWLGPFIPLIILYHPDTVRSILKISAPKPRGQFTSSVYDMALPWLGEGLLISNNERWARNRRLLTPGFHFDILRPYVNIYNTAVEILIDKISTTAKKGETFEVFDAMSLLTLDIILKCAFSYESQCQVQGYNMAYVTAVKELQDIWVARSLKPWLHMDWAFKLTQDGKKFYKHCDYVHSVTEDLIDKRRKFMDSSKNNSEQLKEKKHLDFLDILLTAKDEDGKGLTPYEIRSEADTFLFEGHDTTTSAISWTLYSLAEHPHFQKQVQDEVDEILKDRDSSNIQFEDLPKLVFLGQCIKEGLRLHTPVTFIERELKEELDLEGHIIPPGTMVAMQIYALHHNFKVWDDPMVFKPERFSSENIKDMDPFAFIPFSAGLRNCIGQNFAMHEMKVVIARILHSFTLSLDPNWEVKKAPRAVMKSVNGIKMFATKRT
ncbi:cytochrome P450 4F4 [Patella vulgata]|uniref:cytochrome P450 4F4 n=1 Tax=Patella vulgata TaxID=6465 RepID=UPI0021802526|nr:cytochrome P450 4F4 [Patella vulgata]XP_050413254.1 cytochrome P450 4F4 [Patella vulgata]